MTWYNIGMEIDMNENNWATPCPKYDCKKTACKCGLEYVNIPASLGDDSKESSVAPKNGAYCNAIVEYEANDHIYVYSKEGVPTLIDTDAPQWVTNEIENLKNHIGRPKTLTTADYNWNSVTQDDTEPFDTVALWKLSNGLYLIPNNSTINAKTFKTKSAGTGLFIVSGRSTTKRIYELDESFSYSNKNYHLAFPMHTVTTEGTLRESFNIASRGTINAVVSDYILSGSGAPTTATVGETGSIYVDTFYNEAYVCIRKSGSSYVWRKIT